jgi:hypothetical protein
MLESGVNLDWLEVQKVKIFNENKIAPTLI